LVVGSSVNSRIIYVKDYFNLFHINNNKMVVKRR
jgi:hypothetical protein